jgi:hypothetical protein
MTDSSIFDGIDYPKIKRKKQRGCKCHSNKKQSVLWTVYHTVLALELFIIIIIEGVELYYGF